VREMGGADQKSVIGLIVSAWLRLSETFILNEVIGLERLGTVRAPPRGHALRPRSRPYLRPPTTGARTVSEVELLACGRANYSQEVGTALGTSLGACPRINLFNVKSIGYRLRAVCKLLILG
jgi:hypothetical protein